MAQATIRRISDTVASRCAPRKLAVAQVESSFTSKAEKTMKTSMKRTTIFFFACLLVGCAQIHTSYSPRPIGSTQEVQRSLEQLLREQVSAQPLQDVEVARDYFKCTYVETQTTKFLFVNTGITTVPLSKFVYFNNVRRMLFYNKRSTWFVILGDKAGAEIFSYQTYDEEKAKAFVDIVIGLSGLDASVLSKPW